MLFQIFKNHSLCNQNTAQATVQKHIKENLFSSWKCQTSAIILSYGFWNSKVQKEPWTFWHMIMDVMCLLPYCQNVLPPKKRQSMRNNKSKVGVRLACFKCIKGGYDIALPWEEIFINSVINSFLSLWHRWIRIHMFA